MLQKSLPPSFHSILLIVLFLGLLAFIGWQQITQPVFKVTPLAERQNNTAPETSNNTTATPAPKNQLFYELTIDSLRNREYSSTLNEQSQLRQNADYTSYLTSYTSDGLRINGLLTVPTGQQPEAGWPAIVFVHGYIPPDEYQTQERYEDYVNFLAQNEFVVFKIDLRGHGNSEGEPSGTYFSTDYVVDTLNAYAALQETPFVDAERVGLWGHSMAGNIVLRSMAARPNEIPAAVVWAGAVFTYEDFTQFGIQDTSYQPPSSPSPRRQKRQELFETQGEIDLQSEFWQKVSPQPYLSDIQGRIELHHAQDDAVVDIGYSQNLAELLEEAGVTHQLYEYQSGGHNILNGSFSQAMQRTVTFFQEME